MIGHTNSTWVFCYKNRTEERAYGSIFAIGMQGFLVDARVLGSIVHTGSFLLLFNLGRNEMRHFNCKLTTVSYISPLWHESFLTKLAWNNPELILQKIRGIQLEPHEAPAFWCFYCLDGAPERVEQLRNFHDKSPTRMYTHEQEFCAMIVSANLRGPRRATLILEGPWRDGIICGYKDRNSLIEISHLLSAMCHEKTVRRVLAGNGSITLEQALG